MNYDDVPGGCMVASPAAASTACSAQVCTLYKHQDDALDMAPGIRGGSSGRRGSVQ